MKKKQKLATIQEYWTPERQNNLQELTFKIQAGFVGAGRDVKRFSPMFHFCRGLKSFPVFGELSKEHAFELLNFYFRHGEQRKHVLRAVAPREIEDPIQEFLETWDRVLFAEGERLIPYLRQQMKAWPYRLRPPVSEKYEAAVSFCGHLQELHPNRPFFLSCRVLGEAIEVSHVTAAKYLRYAQQHGFLRLVSRGQRSEDAYEYEFVDDRFEDRRELTPNADGVNPKSEPCKPN